MFVITYIVDSGMSKQFRLGLLVAVGIIKKPPITTQYRILQISNYRSHNARTNARRSNSWLLRSGNEIRSVDKGLRGESHYI